MSERHAVNGLRLRSLFRRFRLIGFSRRGAAMLALRLWR